MTLQQFREATASLDPDTNLLILTPWGEMESASFVTRSDLVEGDPLLDDLDDNVLLLAGEAD